MQKITLIIILHVFFFYDINSQTVIGDVLAKGGTPICFANVVLLSARDSSFIKGTITDENGNFKIEVLNKPSIIKISCLGYYPKFIEAGSIKQKMKIYLKEFSTELDEITIKAVRKSISVKEGEIIANIENSFLSKLGSANDVLSQLPYVTNMENNLMVFGKGKPLVYIDNKLVRNTDELFSLKSHRIKKIKLLMNPGVEYSREGKAVIIIKTIDPLKQGLRASAMAEAKKTNVFSHNEHFDINANFGKVEFLGTISNKIKRNHQNQVIDQYIHLPEETSFASYKSNLQGYKHFLDGFLGVNYSGKKDRGGIKYNLSLNPDRSFNVNNNINFILKQNEKKLVSNSNTKSSYTRQYITGYYHSSFEKLKLQTSLDYADGDMDRDQNTEEKILNEHPYYINSQSTQSYKLYAGKLSLIFPFLSGKINLGSEYIYTKNKQDYILNDEDNSSDLESNYIKNIQNQWGSFFSYQRALGKFNIKAGIRYEDVKFEYYEKGIKIKNQSKSYKNVFPYLSVNYSNSPFSCQLNYSTNIQRPSYYQLRNSVSYNNAYSYEGGNPYLKPCQQQSLSSLVSWKHFRWIVSYNWFKDQILFVARQYKNNHIFLFTSENIPFSQSITSAISFNPTVGIWNPYFEIGVEQQFLNYGNPATHFDKALFSGRFSNRFNLSNNCHIILTFWGNLSGHSFSAYVQESFRSNITLTKSFFNNHLQINLRGYDIFNTYIDDWSMKMDNTSMEKWRDANIHGVSLSVTYTFRETKNLFQDKGAAKKELNRLK